MRDERVYYKVTDTRGRACHGGDLQWSLPTWRAVGAWMPRIDDPLLCERGYHLCRQQELKGWLHEAIWAVELAPEAIVIEGSYKVVTSGPVRLVRRMHWDDRIARLYACDCAERIVHLCGDDPRHRDAIAAARRCTEGQATTAELYAARAAARITARAITARAAAWASSAAAWDTAGVAARAAAWAAAGDAAGTAAWAAGAAARVAAMDTAGVAARAAAWAARTAGDAAWNAAWAAGAAEWAAEAAAWAAGAAAWAAGAAEWAAGTAAWDAARAAERRWQQERLVEYLEGRL